MGHEDGGDLPKLLQPLDLGAELDLLVGIEMRQRLVEQDDFGIAHQRAADGDTLLRAAR